MLDNQSLSHVIAPKAYDLPDPACTAQPTLIKGDAMTNSAAQNTRTFSLKSPADLYRKIHFEALALRSNPPADLIERAYCVMNTVTSAWQMKDWVYCALADAGQLDRLHQFAGREIKGNKDFGRFLTSHSPWMNMCFQLATAAKHFDVNTEAGPDVVTTVDFQFDPGAMAHDLTGREEIMVRTHNNTISGPDLILLLEYIWDRALRDLGLLAAAESDGDRS